MFNSSLIPADTAHELVSIHGAKARQVVVDEIVAAIRRYDLDAAKRWDEVGRTVDSLVYGRPSSPELQFDNAL